MGPDNSDNVFVGFIRKTKLNSLSIISYIILFYLLWGYSNLFLDLSISMIIEMSLDNPFFPNPSYVSAGSLVFIIGGISLVSFILILGEMNLKNLRNYRDWENYFSSLLGILALIFFWFYSSTGDLSPRTEVPFLIIGGVMLTGFILIKNDIKFIAITFSEAFKNRSRAMEIFKQNWKDLLPTILVILSFLAILLNLSLFSSFIPMIGYEQKTFFSIMYIILIGSYLFIMSSDADSPIIAAKKSSSLIFIISIPLFLYLVLRILFLIKTDSSWDISLDFMDFVAGFSITNWPNQVDINNASRWEFHIAGVINGVRAVVVSIFLCTLIGVIIGVMRLSNHKLSSGFATTYVEIFRNMPLALLLFSLGTIIGSSLPEKVEQVNIDELVWLSNQGIYIPAPDFNRLIMGLLLIAAFKIFTSYLDRNGVDDSIEGVRKRGMMWAAIIGISASVIVQAGFDTTLLSKPSDSPGSWKYEGGFKISIEFIALVAGLTIYTSAIVAEIVRGSIQSLPRGQVEAAISLSLNPIQRLRLVILPQALRSMIPSLNNQYMNVWKNSSLALIVSYNDLFYINVVILNKVGKAVPTFFLILISYQIGSLITSALMNMYNRRVTSVKI